MACVIVWSIHEHHHREHSEQNVAGSTRALEQLENRHFALPHGLTSHELARELCCIRLELFAMLLRPARA